eukprot:gene10993-12156_t
MADRNEKDWNSEVDENVPEKWSNSGSKQVFKRLIHWSDKLFNIENHKLVIGLNAGFVSAMITTLYSNPRLGLQARMLVPALCGITGAKTWDNLLTKRIENKDLDCPICANIRGLTIAVLSACVLPVSIGAVIATRRHTGFLIKAERFTESFSDNLIQRPLVVAAVLAQGSLGYIMASREFKTNLLKRLRRK